MKTRELSVEEKAIHFKERKERKAECLIPSEGTVYSVCVSVCPYPL